MKSMDIKRVGSIVTGTAMLGAALASPVMAGMDSTGITKGFFYDATYNPIVQIVVGEKVGNAADFVAAGNIAATVGNLAYMTKSVTPSGPSYTPEGQVVITTAARGAIGDYVQDTNVRNEPDISNFYQSDNGLHFEGEKVYEKDDFTSYTLSCDKQSRTEATILLEGSYTNVHCLFCKTLCLNALKNPSHDMKESITIDSDGIRYYEDGLQSDDSEALKLAIDKKSIAYKVETDFIPLKTITQKDCTSDTAGDCDIDFEYRGKMILFGDDSYYVKDVDSDKIYLAKAKVLDDVTSEAFTSEYNGYKFKIDHLMYSAEYTVAGLMLDVKKPDGSQVQVQISKMANSPAIDGKLELAGVYAQDAGTLQSASIIVYDLDSQVVLQDGEDLEIGGKTMTDWEVAFNVIDDCNDDADCSVENYDEMASKTDSLLKDITITYNHELDGDEALETDESLPFPNNFKLTFKGYQTNNFAPAPCSGAGQGNIKLEKGDSPYQMVMSLTGEDNNKYSNVRLDEGPFKKNELFMANGVIYKYASEETDSKDTGKTDDQIKVVLDPTIRGSRVTVDKMQRFCDPEDAATAGDETYTHRNCEDFNDISVVELALTDALRDDDNTKLENDKVVKFDAYRLFIKPQAMSGAGATKLDVLFDDEDNTIFLAQNFYAGGVIADPYLEVNPNQVGTFSDFKVNGYELDMRIVQEAGLLTDVNSTAYNAAQDLNKDNNDDDTLVVFNVEDGQVVVDMTDRAYNADIDSDYKTSTALWNPALVGGAKVDKANLKDNKDTMLITPEGGDTFTLDWGSDNRLDSVDLCHPQEKVDSTYFIGKDEESTTTESTITKADEGKDVSAGCCTFTVSKFDVNVGNATGTATTTAVVNPIVGNMVVTETGADTSKNLVIIGGPVVNGMSTVAKDDIGAAADKYIVKKDGNMVMVAGWEADDTVAAGNVLINWLKANVHA